MKMTRVALGIGAVLAAIQLVPAWPPQAYVAPVSWLVAHDVQEEREELNFSRWGPDQVKRTVKDLPSEVEKRDMPPSLSAPGYVEVAGGPARTTRFRPDSLAS